MRWWEEGRALRKYLFCFLLLLTGCHIWPSVKFDFSYLGGTPIDKLIVNDCMNSYSDGGMSLSYSDPSVDTPLPADNRFVQEIENLLYKGSGKSLPVSKADVEKIGAVCSPQLQKLCEYDGVVMAHWYGGSMDKITMRKYKILFHLDDQPLKIEVFKDETAVRKQGEQ